MLNPWLALSFKVFQLGIEAQSVVALRMMRLASGGAGTQAEMGRMMVEKAAAVTEAQFAAATAAVAGSKDHVIAGKALKVFRRRVRANRRDAFHVVKSASLLSEPLALAPMWLSCGKSVECDRSTNGRLPKKGGQCVGHIPLDHVTA